MVRTTVRNGAEDCIRNRTEFTASAMSGGVEFRGFGRLDYKWRGGLFVADHRGTLEYIVYSYATPIGWVDNGTVVIPDDKYSVTTSKHQQIVRMSLR